MGRALQLGLTGGIGSGKSTVAGLLQALGATVIDADAIARSVTAPGGAAIAPIRERFGADMIDASGAMDRARMRALAFSDPQAKRALEAIVHPLVGQETARQVQAARGPLTVLDIPLLVEGGHWRTRLDRVLVVDCLPETQVQRVMTRSGLAPEAVRAIMAAQASRERRLAAADAVIFNDGLDLAQLGAEVRVCAAGFGL